MLTEPRLEHKPQVNGVERRRTMLCPVAYNETVMPTLQLARSSRTARKLANFLMTSLVVSIVVMAFAPWQQSIWGTGNVIAFAPDKRQQIIEAPITGRIVRWGENIFENARVEKGELIAEISDLDEGYTMRLGMQLQNAKLAAEAAGNTLQANMRARDALYQAMISLETQIERFEEIKRQTEDAQTAFVRMATDRVRAEQRGLAEAKAALPQLEAEYGRMKRLAQIENVSVQEFQITERKYREAEERVGRAEAFVDAAKSDLEGKQSERDAAISRAQLDIDLAKARVDSFRGEISRAEGAVESARQSFKNAEQSILNLETIIARQQNQTLVAPFDGFIVKITPNMNTAVLKQGDHICTIVPDTEDRAVQIWLSGNDAPLVKPPGVDEEGNRIPGSHVRLQFEGWPALQFAGWPAVAIGTFGGEVVSVDSIDDGIGRFRVLIRPDDDDISWPEGRFLRQGVRANGWVLLNQVPLWFEVWRRLNAFPPVVDMEGGDSYKSGAKPPKLPK